MVKIKYLTFVLIISLLLITLPSCGNNESLNRYQAEFLKLFDTATIIVAYAPSEEDFMEKAEKIRADLEVYHQLYDIYNNYEGLNNIKTINDNAGLKPVKVDQKIIDLLKFSKYIYVLSKGQVNIALGSVLSIWHDYRTFGIDNPDKAKLPPMEELEAAATHTDIEDVLLDESAGTVFLSDPLMSLDVGAIAKGYAVERVSEYAKSIGFTDGLISVGGNLRAMGKKGSGKELWKLGIQNPDKDSERRDLFVIKDTDVSLVTSGDYQRYFTVDGNIYHHIIDPDTLMPADFYRAVTIITENSGLADGLSTAIYLMSYEEGHALIESLAETEALWVFKDGSCKYTDGFEALLEK